MNMEGNIYSFQFSAIGMILSTIFTPQMGGCMGKIKAISIKNDPKADVYP
jgi:hypothetical protein